MKVQLVEPPPSVMAGADPVSMAIRQRATIEFGSIKTIKADGCVVVSLGPEIDLQCLVLHSGATPLVLAAGDLVLVAWTMSGARTCEGVVLGSVGPLGHLTSHMTIEATESLTLKCGEAQVDLRADGKVMVKGEDVLIRAKGTQRIRAGNVAIN